MNTRHASVADLVGDVLGPDLPVRVQAYDGTDVGPSDAPATIVIRSPLFEYLRQPSSLPMREYYAAAYTECLRLCDVDGVVTVDGSAPGCQLTLAMGVPRAASAAQAGGA